MKTTATVISQGQKKEIPVCCEQFAIATRMGTGHDGHKPAIQYNGGKWVVGSDRLQYVKRCPWCANPTVREDG